MSTRVHLTIDPPPRGYAVRSFLLHLVFATAALGVVVGSYASTEPPDCTVSILNQSAAVQEDATWFVPSVPGNMGWIRARVNCTSGGVTTAGTSDLFQITNGRMHALPAVPVASPAPTPVRTVTSADPTTLTGTVPTTQLDVIATYSDGSSGDVGTALDGTTFFTTDPSVATVDDGGLVTAVASGAALVSSLHEGILSGVTIIVVAGADTDDDGMPDDWEVLNDLDPLNAADAVEDPDQDGLLNLDEFLNGTDPWNADTDEDTIVDGEEVIAGLDGYVTSPVLADTDGDCVRDALEIQLGTDPTDPASRDYDNSLVSLALQPASFELIINQGLGTAESRQLTALGDFVDGSTCDVTEGKGVFYASDAPTVATVDNAGAGDEGRVTPVAGGVAVLSAALGLQLATSTVTVTDFSPRGLAWLPLPGYANDVALSGDGSLVAVASGAAGLQLVDVSDPEAPFVVGSWDSPGNATGVAILGDFAYVSDAGFGLFALDISEPTTPTLHGSLESLANVTSVAVDGAHAYLTALADGLHVVSLDPLDPSALVLEGTVVLTDPFGIIGLAADVSVRGSVASVSARRRGIFTVDVADPASPLVLGHSHTRSTETSHAAHSVLRGEVAVVADGSDLAGGTLTTMDVSSPEVPFRLAASDVVTGPTGLALDREYAVVSDHVRVSAAGIYALANDAPDQTGVLDFSMLADRADRGTAIAVKDGMSFMTACATFIQEGVAGDCGLYVGEHARFGPDLAGIAPTVEVTAPAAGAGAPERSLVTVVVEAEDDVALDRVEFLQDGAVVRTRHAPPWRVRVAMPSLAAGETGATVELSARAVDTAGNAALSATVPVDVTPNTLPEVQLLAPPEGAEEPAGVPMELVAQASDDVSVEIVDFLADGVVVATATEAPYRASYVPPVGPATVSIVAAAWADGGAQRTATVPVVVTLVPDQPPTASVVDPEDGAELVVGSLVPIRATVHDDGTVISVAFEVQENGGAFTSLGMDDEPPFEVSYQVPEAGVSDVGFRATATDDASQATVSATVFASIIADPLTTAVGFAVLADGTPAVGADVVVSGLMTTTGADGSYSIVGVPTSGGLVHADIELFDPAEGTFRGTSNEALPVRGGTTDLGTTPLSLVPGGHLMLVGLYTSSAGEPDVAIVDIRTDEVVTRFDLSYDDGVTDGYPTGLVVHPTLAEGLVIDDRNARLVLVNLEGVGQRGHSRLGRSVPRGGGLPVVRGRAVRTRRRLCGCGMPIGHDADEREPRHADRVGYAGDAEIECPRARWNGGRSASVDRGGCRWARDGRDCRARRCRGALGRGPGPAPRPAAGRRTRGCRARTSRATVRRGARLSRHAVRRRGGRGRWRRRVAPPNLPGRGNGRRRRHLRCVHA